LKFPYEVKLSQEFAFLAVTLVSGEVKLFRMPSIYNPLEMPTPTPEVVAQQPTAGKDAKLQTK
jgi:hypothetical protein